MTNSIESYAIFYGRRPRTIVEFEGSGLQYGSSRGSELTLPLGEILPDLSASQQGLSSDKADGRLKTYGPNVLTKEKKLRAPLKFLSYFKNPLVIQLHFSRGF